MPTIHPILPCSDSENRIRLGLKGDGLLASTGDLMDPSKVLILKLPQTSLIPHQQEEGTSPDVGMSSQIT